MNQEIEISPHSWHLHVRNWTYLVRDQRPPVYDNLCNYMQTVLIYAPLLALFRGYTKASLVPIHLLLVLTGIIGLISSLFQPALVDPVTLTAFLIGVFGYYLLVLHHAARIFHWGFLTDYPVLGWAIAFCLAVLGILYGQVLTPTSMMTADRVIPLWWIAAMVVTSPLFGVVVAAFLGLMYVISAALLTSIVWICERFPRLPRFGSRPKTGSSIFDLIWSYLRAQKDRFCPTLRVPVDPKRK